MPATYLGSLTVGQVAPGLASAIVVIDEVRAVLQAQLDALAAAKLSIRATAIGDIQASLDASLAVSASLDVQVTALVSAAISLAAELTITPPTIDVSASFDIQASLQLQIAAFDLALAPFAAIAAAFQKLLAVLDGPLALAAALTASGVHVARYAGAPTSLGADVGAALSAPLAGATDCQALVLVTITPVAAAALAVLLVLPPMSTNLTEVSQFDANVAVPLGTEPRTAASVRTAFQALANRTRWIYDRLLNGVKRFQFVTSTAALKALPTPANNDMAIVLGANGGIYLFGALTIPPSSDTPGQVYVGTGGTTGAWLNILSSSNRLLTIKSALDKTSTAVSITDAHQVGPQIVFDQLQAGDIVVLDADCVFDPNGSSTANTLCISVNGTADPDSTIPINASASSPVRAVSIHHVFTVPATTAWTFQLRAEVFAASSPAAKVRPNYRLRALVYRP